MIRISRARLLSVAAVAGLAAATTVLTAPTAQASTHGAHRPAKPHYVSCDPRAGTILSSKAITYARAWLPTTVSSSYESGPATISYSKSKSTTTTKQISASFSLDEGLFFASAKETYGVSLSKASTATEAFNYSSQVPKGVTARMQVFKEGGEFGIKQRYVKQYVSHCSNKTETSPTGNYFPLSTNRNSAYCLALVSKTRIKPQVRKLCKNSF